MNPFSVSTRSGTARCTMHSTTTGKRCSTTFSQPASNWWLIYLSVVLFRVINPKGLLSTKPTWKRVDNGSRDDRLRVRSTLHRYAGGTCQLPPTTHTRSPRASSNVLRRKQLLHLGSSNRGRPFDASLTFLKSGSGSLRRMMHPATRSTLNELDRGQPRLSRWTTLTHEHMKICVTFQEESDQSPRWKFFEC